MLQKNYQSSEVYNSVEENLINFYPNNNPHPAFGDFNGDGYVDILHNPSHFTHEPFLQPIVYTNTGSSFNVSKLPAGGIEYGRWTLVEDFNHDGYDDVIIADTGLERPGHNFFGANIEYLQGSANGLVNVSDKITGTPNWQGNGAFNHISSLGDIDKDGDLDLLVADFRLPAIYENTGNGEFDYASDEIVVPGLNTDIWNEEHNEYSGIGFVEDKFGTPTIVAGGYRNFGDPSKIQRGIDILQQDEDGIWQIVQELEKPDVGPYKEDYGVTTVQSSDVDGDGDQDFIVELEGNYHNASEDASLGSTMYGVYIQDDNGNFAVDLNKTVEKVMYDGKGTVGFRLQDFNGDGFDDIFASGTGVELAKIHESVLLNDRNGNFSPINSSLMYIDKNDMPDYELFSVVPHWADMDKDGSIDLVTIHPEFTHTEQGSGTIGEQVIVYSQAENIFSQNRLYLEDRSIAFDIDGNAGQAYRLYSAAFDRTPDAEGLGYWINMLDTEKLNLLGTANSFLESAEFKNTYGSNPTNEQYITALYNNVLGRDPDAEGFAWWLNDLENTPGFTKAHLLYHFSESAENKQKTADQIANGIEFAVWNNEFTVDDGVANISYSEHLGSLASVVTATLGVETLRDANIVNIGLDLYEQGWTDKMVAGAALDYIGDYTVEDTVDTLYENLVGVTPTPSQAQVYVDMANSMGRDEFAVWASEFSEEFTPLHIPTLQNFGLDIV